MLKTFLLKSKQPNNRGLTLLEIVIVVAIIAFVSVIAIPKLGGRKTQMQAAVRKISILTREIKYNSKLQNATFRMAFRMADPDDKESISEFWIEKAPGSVILSADMSEEDLAELQDIQKNGDDEEKQKLATAAFQIDGKILKKPEELPEGLRFERVELGSRAEPITSGIAYIYFLPEGYVDEAAIHIVADKLHWTVAIAPLTGRADVIDGDVSLNDLRSQ